MINYQKKYLEFIEELHKRIVIYYGKKLVSIILYGSVGRGRFRPDSDIDILIIAEDLPKGRTTRIEEFQEKIESPLSDYLHELSKEGIDPFISPIIKTKNETQQGSPLFLDMIEDAKFLYDNNNYFKEYLCRLNKKLKEMGAKKIFFKGGYYWLLKPDYKWGDVIEL